MKNITLSLLAIITLFSCKKEQEIQQDVQYVEPKNETKINMPPNTPLTTMSFDKETHDFGTISNKDSVTTTFKVKNTGANPLIISEVRATCGCTTPKKPTAPILPGKEDVIEVTYKPNKEGHVEKMITVIANVAEKNKVLNIKANVEPQKK